MPHESRGYVVCSGDWGRVVAHPYSKLSRKRQSVFYRLLEDVGPMKVIHSIAAHLFTANLNS